MYIHTYPMSVSFKDFSKLYQRSSLRYLLRTKQWKCQCENFGIILFPHKFFGWRRSQGFGFDPPIIFLSYFLFFESPCDCYCHLHYSLRHYEMFVTMVCMLCYQVWPPAMPYPQCIGTFYILFVKTMFCFFTPPLFKKGSICVLCLRIQHLNNCCSLIFTLLYTL